MASTAPTPPVPRGNRVAERIWRRFTPAQRLTRFAVYLVIVAAIVLSVRTVEVIPEFLADLRYAVELDRRL